MNLLFERNHCLIGFFLLILLGCAPPPQSTPQSSCEWCGAQDAPTELTCCITIPPADEPGEPLHIEGRVFLPDGITPAQGILLYVYHTNQEGIYPKRGNETGNGRRHGYLRGWMRTDANGHYAFRTIKPAPYPAHNEPAHIHLTLSGPDRAEDWMDSFVFAGDPLMREKDRVLHRSGGDGPALVLVKDADGVWQGKRDIVLKE